MTRARWFGLLVLPGALAAQTPTTLARTGVTFESYAFGAGLPFKRISELTIPISVTQRIGGGRLVLDLGTAFARASVTAPAGASGGGSITHSGFVDTDLRASYGLIPGKLLFNVVGTIPTGAGTVADTTIPLFGATGTHLFGFTTPSFGSGGAVSAGFSSAVRMGQNWAIGTGASYRYAARYVPVQGGDEMSPGGEIRARFGVEGPFGGGKYFRGALVYTITGANDLGATAGGQSTIGDRVLGYVAVNVPVGNSQLSLYGWDMRRWRARHADSAGTLSVPRGNVLAVGARLDRPAGPKATLSPTLEFRHELTGPGQRMELLGYLLRAGTDVRYRLSDRTAAVMQAQLAVGTLHDAGTSVSILGPRLGVMLEWSRP